jgi:hypothetical protein
LAKISTVGLKLAYPNLDNISTLSAKAQKVRGKESFHTKIPGGQGKGLNLEHLSFIVNRDVEKVAKLAFRESLYGTNNKFLVNAKLAFPDAINLIYREAHRARQLGQGAALTPTQFKDFCSDVHR